MPEWGTIGSFAVASLLLALLPGPAVMYIVNRSISDGRRIALTSVSGLTLGNFFHALAASVGLSAVLVASSAAFNVVKWLGVTYLVVTGIRALLTRPEALAGDNRSMTAVAAFRQGVIVNSFNPKVALFFLSFLPQFVDPDLGSPGLQSLVLGSTFVVIGAMTDASYALASSAVRGLLVNERTVGFVRRWVSGSVFVGLGLVAATTSRR